MPAPTTSYLKKALSAEGFEVYRAVGSRIVLAERVRDNLIMDSGVTVIADGQSLCVQFIARAQRSDFPNEAEAWLFERARRLAEAALGRGYREACTMVVPVLDPMDRSHTLDVWYDVRFEKSVSTESQLFEELRYVLALEKTACQGPG